MKLGLTWREQLGDPECPYMVRWVLNLGHLGSLRLHHWFRSDDKRNKHDHPSDFITLVLKGSYEDLGDHPCWDELYHLSVEHDFEPQLDFLCTDGDGYLFCEHCGQPCSRDGRSIVQQMRPGTIAYRHAEHTHTVSVNPGGCWTLLYFFPERRQWGFWVPRKLDGKLKFKKANKYFLEHGHHPCDQP